MTTNSSVSSNSNRPPLIPSSAPNNNALPPPPRRHRKVASRYLCASPNSNAASFIFSKQIESETLNLSKRNDSPMLDLPNKSEFGIVNLSKPSESQMLKLSKHSDCPMLNLSKRSDSSTFNLSSRIDSPMPNSSKRSDSSMLNLSKRSQSQMLTRGEDVMRTPSRSKSTIKRREGEVMLASILSKSETPILNLSKQNESRMLTRGEVVTPNPIRSSNLRRFKSDNVGISDAERMLMKAKRGLSVSFQGENKAMVKPSPAVKSSGSSRVRKGMDERRKLTPLAKDQKENVKICDGNMWNRRSKAMDSPISTRSLDCGNNKLELFGSSSHIRESQNSVRGSSNSKSKRETRFKSDRVNSEVIGKAQCDEEMNSGSISVKSTDSGVSGSDNTSSGLSKSTLGGSVVKEKGGRCDVLVPARFLQETNGRRRVEVEIASGPSTPIVTKKYLLERPATVSRVESGHGRFASPIRGEMKLASVSKRFWTPMNCLSPRGMSSLATTRNGTPKRCHDNPTPSILSFNDDIRRVAGGENRVEDAHELRMLHNRQLQWRFINARAEVALLARSGTAERNLYNASVAISKLQHSVESKRITLQLLRQNLNLYSLLKGQLQYLESWSLIDQDHCILLSEAREALQTSIANLPLVNGAKADIELVNKAICSAAEVMQGVTSSVGSHLTMVEQVSSLTSELSNTAANEIDLIDQGKNLLSELAALQVNDCSLKVHILQLPH